MKASPGIVPQILLIILGILLILPVLFSSKWTELTISDLTLGAILYLFVALFPLLFGLWRIETIEVSGHILKKTNCAGLIRRSWDLRFVYELKKRSINNSLLEGNGAASFTTLFSDNPRYFKFRIATVRFSNRRRVRISEIGMAKEEFNEIYKAILKFDKANQLTRSRNQ